MSDSGRESNYHQGDMHPARFGTAAGWRVTVREGQTVEIVYRSHNGAARFFQLAPHRESSYGIDLRGDAIDVLRAELAETQRERDYLRAESVVLRAQRKELSTIISEFCVFGFPTTERLVKRLRELVPEKFMPVGEARTTREAWTCPTCRHAIHARGRCLNMASDHDCECQAGSDASPRQEGE